MYTLTPFEYLDSLLIDYTVIPHSTTFTAQETAESAHIKGAMLSKVIVVSSGQLMSMVVIPAHSIVVKKDLSRLLQAPDLEIAQEHQFSERFPECETGAMPPFGKLYSMNVYLARDLAERDNIIFNGGTHNLLIKMSVKDFISVSDARVISVGYRKSNLIGSRLDVPVTQELHWIR